MRSTMTHHHSYDQSNLETPACSGLSESCKPPARSNPFLGNRGPPCSRHTRFLTCSFQTSTFKFSQSGGTDNVVCCCMFFVNLSPDTCGSGFSIRRLGRVSPSQKTQNDAFMQGTMVKAGRSPLNVVVDEVITSCFLRTEEHKGTNSCDYDGSTCTSFVLQYLLVEVTSSRRKLNSQPQMFHQQAIFMDLGPGNPELML